MIAVPYKPFPSRTYKWSVLALSNPDTGTGARKWLEIGYYKTRKDAQRAAAVRVPRGQEFIIGQVQGYL